MDTDAGTDLVVDPEMVVDRKRVREALQGLSLAQLNDLLEDVQGVIAAASEPEAKRTR